MQRPDGHYRRLVEMQAFVTSDEGSTDASGAEGGAR